MLNRNDLSKQFSLVVQQEIKNHNDQMLSTNISINEIKEEIRKNKEEQNKINVEFASQITKINTNCLELSECALNLSKNFYNLQKKLDEFIEKATKEIKLFVENSIVAHSKHEHNKNSIEDLKFEISNIQDDIIGRSNYQTQELELNLKKSKEYTEKCKKEILEIPSEAQEVKVELQKQMSIDRVDFQSIMREMQVYKKTCFILEKNQEHIYTLIERLKQG